MNDFTYTPGVSSIQVAIRHYFMKETIMIYIFLLGFVVIVFSLMLSSFFSSKSWETDGRMINADWMASEEKFHFITRWGAQ
jgi:hypothetical protein